MALQPDVIVMDTSMPQMNGIEATRKIHETLPHIHIVGFSTHDDENSERSMRQGGSTSVLHQERGGRSTAQLPTLAPLQRPEGAATN